MKKTLATIVLVLFALATLSACGSDKNAVKINYEEKVTLDVMDPVAKNIKAISDKGYAVFVTSLLNVDEDGKVRLLGDRPSRTDLEGSFYVEFDMRSVDFNDNCSKGYVEYYVYKNDDSPNATCSLFPKWKGDFDQLDQFLTDDYCIEINTSGSNVDIAVFKDGKLVKMNDILSEYGDKAKEVMAYPSLFGYYSEREGLNSYEAYERMCGALMLDEWRYERNSYDTMYVAVYCALTDWRYEFDEGKISNYGIVKKDYFRSNYFSIIAPCPIEDYVEVKYASLGLYRE